MSRQMSPKPIAKNPIAAHSMDTQSKNPRKSRAKPAKRICYRNSINNIKDRSLFAGLQAGKPIWAQNRCTIGWKGARPAQDGELYCRGGSEKSYVFSRNLIAGVMRS